MECVSATYDKKTGIITVTATLTDPVVAATVARLSFDYLTNYISSYRTEKSSNQVEVSDSTNYRSQKPLSESGICPIYLPGPEPIPKSATAKIEEQRLQADFLLTQNLFNELSNSSNRRKLK